MKNILILLVLAVSLCACDRTASIDRNADQQVALMTAVSDAFPKVHGYVGKSFDVQSTTSLVNPIVGQIDVTDLDTKPGLIDAAAPHKRFMFAWRKDHWAFDKVVNRDNGENITRSAEVRLVMKHPEMNAYLVKYGWDSPSAIESDTASASR